PHSLGELEREAVVVHDRAAGRGLDIPVDPPQSRRAHGVVAEEPAEDVHLVHRLSTMMSPDRSRWKYQGVPRGRSPVPWRWALMKSTLPIPPCCTSSTERW